MTDHPAPPKHPDNDPRTITLARISTMLGITVEVLADPEAVSDLDETVELLRLWQKVVDPEARRAVIAHLRRLGSDGSEVTTR